MDDLQKMPHSKWQNDFEMKINQIKRHKNQLCFKPSTDWFDEGG